MDMNEIGLRSFGRIKGRPLKPRQAALVEGLLPKVSLPAAGSISPDALFPGLGGPVTLEIGFGGGEHLCGLAQGQAEGRFLGVEPFLNGVGSCLRHIEQRGLGNVRLHQGDAREVMARLPPGAVDAIYLLFPDPWPKARHWKRRLVQPGFIAEAARILRPGGELRFATDWAHYGAWTLELFLREPRFSWMAESSADWRGPWPGHLPTRYEQKRLGDTEPLYFRFLRGAV